MRTIFPEGTVQCISGASDDLIEIEANGKGLREELSASMHEGEDQYVVCSDATLLKVRYDGFWRFDVYSKGAAFHSHVAGTDIEEDYTDRVYFSAPLKFVALTDKVAQ